MELFCLMRSALSVSTNGLPAWPEADASASSLARCLPAVVADLPGHRQLFAVGIQRVLDAQVVRAVAPEHRQLILFAAGDDAGMGNYLERAAVQAGIVGRDDDEVAECRFDILIERHQLVVAEGEQKAAAGRTVGRVIDEEAVVADLQGLVEIPGLERLFDLGSGHAVPELADFP